MELVSQETEASAADDRELVLLVRRGRQGVFVEIVERGRRTRLFREGLEEDAQAS